MPVESPQSVPFRGRPCNGKQRTIFGPAHSFVLKGKNHLPILLHADDCPAVLLRLVVERLRERADFRVGKPFSGTVRVLPLCVIVQHEQRKPRAVAGLGIFEHLLVAGRVAEGDVRAAADHKMDAFGFAGIVVIEHDLRFLGQERLTVLVIAILGPARRADDLLGRNAVGLSPHTRAQSPDRRR